MKGLPQFINSLVILILIPFNSLFSQPTFIKSDIDLLKEISSDSYWGRSIFKNGKSKALKTILDYIDSNSDFEYEIRLIKADTIPFNQLNRFKLLMNDTLLIPELDYMPFGTLSNSDLKVSIDRDFISTDTIYNRALVISYNQFRNQQLFSAILAKEPKIIFIESTSLSFAPQTYQVPIPIIFIRKSLLKQSDLIQFNSNATLEPYPIINAVIFNKPKELVKRVTFMAHYDHLGTINDTLIFNGANDNASGAVLATQLFIESSKKELPSQLFLTDAEEIGLLGSRLLNKTQFTNQIEFLINIDMCASGDGSYGIVGLSASDSTFQTHINKYLRSQNHTFKFRDNVPNSDHYWFLDSQKNGFYIYTQNGKQPYHSVYDDFNTLDKKVYKSTLLLLQRLILERFNYSNN
ncbi:M28 family peptidase [bacterium]|nr:MAG: M28 family peptidase [bacterium]